MEWRHFVTYLWNDPRISRQCISLRTTVRIIVKHINSFLSCIIVKVHQQICYGFPPTWKVRICLGRDPRCARSVTCFVFCLLNCIQTSKNKRENKLLHVQYIYQSQNKWHWEGLGDRKKSKDKKHTCSVWDGQECLWKWSGKVGEFHFLNWMVTLKVSSVTKPNFSLLLIELFGLCAGGSLCYCTI